MGLMSKIFGEPPRVKDLSQYIELSADGLDTGVEADLEVKIASIGDRSDTIAIKDAVYEGDIVLADISRHTTQDRTMEHIIDELKQATTEVGGDIVQKNDDQLIITPKGVTVDRERLV